MFYKRVIRGQVENSWIFDGGGSLNRTSRRNFWTGMAAQGLPGCKVRELTNEEREAVVCSLLGQFRDCALLRGIIKEKPKII